MSLLKDIVTIEKGRKYNLLDSFEQDAIRVFQANDFRNENKPLYTFDDDGVLANEDDIMLVWDGSVGQMGFGREGYVGSTMVKLKVKNKKEFSPFFIFKFLQTKSEYLKRKSTGATIMHINRKSLEQLEIPKLSYSDQIQIANILSKAETLIEQRKQSIALLDEYLKSTYSEMFGQMNEKNFPLEKLDDISTKINDGEHGSVEKTETGVLYLMARNINRQNEIDLKEISFVSREAHKKMFKRCNPEKGDILIVCVGATIGKVVIVPVMEEFSIARSVALVKPDYKKVNSKYLLWYFNSALAKRQIKSSSLTAAQAGLYIGKIKEIKIPVPPLTIQNKFSDIVTKAETLKEQYKNSLVELENLYGSLSQRAFKGELEMKMQTL